ncbi:MAG: Gldg family protein, partial [Anaerolineales bacterium]
DQSVQVNQRLTDSVLAKAFYSQNIPDEKARTLLENYKFHSRGKFDYQFIDPVTNPIAAKEAGVTRDGTIVLAMGNRIEHVTSPSEQELTSALIRLTNPGKRTIYFLTGHGESIPQDQEGLYSQLRQNLLSKNYALDTLNLLAQPDIPSTATEVVILNPLKPLTGGEVSALSAYLDSGGALILLSEPPAVTNSDPITDQLWEYLSTDWGINCENNILIDPNSAPPLMVISQPLGYSEHPITAEMSNMVAVFPTAHSLAIDTSLHKVDITELAKTSASTWGETDVTGLRNQQMKPDAETDQNGPLTIAIAAQNLSTGARLVVIGDADFANDEYFQAFGNSDLITKAIDWAAKQDDLINLNTEPDITRVLIPPTQSVFLLIVLIVTILLPVSVIVIGIIVSLRRGKSG